MALSPIGQVLAQYTNTLGTAPTAAPKSTSGQIPVGKTIGETIANIAQHLQTTPLVAAPASNNPNSPDYDNSTPKGLDPGVQKSQALNNIYQQQIAELGGKTTSKRPSLIHRVFDILSRPEYATANAVLQGVKANVNGAGIGGTLGAIGSGALSGLEGKNKTQYENIAQYVKDAEHAAKTGKAPNQVVTGEGGNLSNLAEFDSIVGDIALDPLNLVGGVGLAKGLTNTAKVAADTAEAGQGAKTAAEIARSFGKGKLPPEAAQLSEILKPATAPVTDVARQAGTNKVQSVIDALKPVIEDSHLKGEQSRQAKLGNVIESEPKLTTFKIPKRKSYPDIISAQHLTDVMAPEAGVAATAKRVGQDSDQLHLPRNNPESAPYVQTLGTLNNYIERATKKAGRDLTEEERTAATDHWWNMAHRDETRIVQSAADPSWAFKSKNEYINGAKNLGKTLYSGKDVEVAGRKIDRLAWNAGNEYDAIKSLRGKLTHQINPESLALRDTVRAKNMRLAAEISGKASESAAKAHKAISSNLLEEAARAFDPEITSKFGVKLKGLDKRIEPFPMTQERIAGQLAKVANTPVGDSIKAFQKAFVSTGKMSPAMQALAGESRGIQQGPHRALIREITEDFKGKKQEDVATALKSVITGNRTLGANPELEDAVERHLEKIVDVLRDGTARKNGVTVGTYNAYLPKELKMAVRENPDLVKAVTESSDKTQALSAFKQLLAPSLEKVGKSHPINVVHDLRNASIKVQANKAIRSDLARRFGVPLKDSTGKSSEAAQQLVDQHGYRKLKVASATPNHVYHPEVADQAERMLELLGSHQQGEDFVKGINKVLSVWKKMATIYNFPGYLTRNVVTNIYVSNLIGGLTGAKGIESQILGLKLLGYKLDKDVGESINPVKAVMAKQLKDEDGVGPVGKVLFYNHNIKDLPGGAFSPDLTLAAFQKAGLESTFTGSLDAANNPALKTGVRGALHKVNEANLSMNKKAEDASRYAVFIHHLRTGSGTFQDVVDNAANQVRKSLFDYNDVTPFEKKAMVKLFPFYKWNRKAVPALFHGLLDHPGKVLGVQEALRGGLQIAGGQQPDLQDPWGLNNEPINRVPSWIQDRLSVPFGGTKSNGGQTYLDPTTPFNDELRLLGDPSSVASQITPLLRVPIEDTTRQQFFHNLPIKNPLEYSTIQQSNLLRELTKATSNSAAPVGQSGLGGQTAPAPGHNILQNILSTLNPITSISGVQQNTPKSQESALLTSNTKYLAERKKLLAALAGQ